MKKRKVITRRRGLLSDVQQAMQWAREYTGCFSEDRIEQEQYRLRALARELADLLRTIPRARRGYRARKTMR